MEKIYNGMTQQRYERYVSLIAPVVSEGKMFMDMLQVQQYVNIRQRIIRQNQQNIEKEKINIFLNNLNNIRK